MLDCSPQAVAISPTIRVNKVLKSKDSLVKMNEDLMEDKNFYEEQIITLQQSIVENKQKLKTKQQDIDTLETKLKNVEDTLTKVKYEAQHLIDSTARYQKMSQRNFTNINSQDLQEEIANTRTQIINMEKQILEYKKINSINNKIKPAQEIRTKLLKRDAKLIEILNALTLKLRVLKYTGDPKLLTDSDIIIEKQLTSEEIRGELERELNTRNPKRRVKKHKAPNKAKDKKPAKTIKADGKSQKEIFKKQKIIKTLDKDILQLYNDNISSIEKANAIDKQKRKVVIEKRKLQTTIQTAKDRLNEYLKRERKVDMLEHDKRRLTTTLEQIQNTVDKHQKIKDTWIKKKNDVEQTQYMIQQQINSLRTRVSPDVPTILNELRTNKQLYIDTHNRLQDLEMEYKNLDSEARKTQSITYRNKLDQLQDDVQGLEIVLKNLEERRKTYNRLNSDEGIREMQNIDRDILKIENDINDLVKSSSKMRNQRKIIQHTIQVTKANLYDIGHEVPIYQSKGGAE